MPGGLAESTGLLSVNDEVIEVNGIEVSGKTLDQVTDMMVANSSNLIITVKPTNQRYNLNRNMGTSNQSSGESSNKFTKSIKRSNNSELLNNGSQANISAYGSRSFSFNNNIPTLRNNSKMIENGYLGERISSVSTSSEVSSVNSSFSSAANNKEKPTAISPNFVNEKVTELLDNQITLHNQKIDISPAKNRIINENENNKNEYEEEIDDDDDEEIHDANENSSPDNSDDKILTL